MRVDLSEKMRIACALAQRKDNFRIAAENASKIRLVKELIAEHPTCLNPDYQFARLNLESLRRLRKSWPSGGQKGLLAKMASALTGRQVLLAWRLSIRRNSDDEYLGHLGRRTPILEHAPEREASQREGSKGQALGQRLLHIRMCGA